MIVNRSICECCEQFSQKNNSDVWVCRYPRPGIYVAWIRKEMEIGDEIPVDCDYYLEQFMSSQDQ